MKGECSNHLTTVDKPTIFEPKLAGMGSVDRPVRNMYKYIQNLQALQGYIFRILQHFASELCSFTNFKMLIPAVLIDVIVLQLMSKLSPSQ